MDFWTFDNFRKVTAGRWLNLPTDNQPTYMIRGLSIDSRTLMPGQVFCAIKGENFDGHDYLAKAIEAGSPVLVIDNESSINQLELSNAAVLLVNNVISAMAHLAGAYRKTFSAKVIGVTGSVGKTTTKQIIHSILNKHMQGKASPKSFNNHIGVPITLLNVEPSDRYVIVEIGSNAPGEIATLSRIATPDIAVITNVGLAHLEKLGTLENIANEKAGVLSCLADNGQAIVNGDCEYLKPHFKLARSAITFGESDDCDMRLTQCEADGEKIKFQINQRAWFSLPLHGVHNAINAIAAIAVARHMNLSDQQIADGLRETKPMPMRLNVVKIGTAKHRITLINDAYNANPQSMASAIDTLGSYPCTGRRIAILGDMLELGDSSKQLHHDLGQLIANSPVDEVYFIGPLSCHAADAALEKMPKAKIHRFKKWTDKIPAKIASRLTNDDAVLIKASRAMELERIIPEIQKRFN